MGWAALAVVVVGLMALINQGEDGGDGGSTPNTSDLNPGPGPTFISPDPTVNITTPEVTTGAAFGGEAPWGDPAGLLQAIVGSREAYWSQTMPEVFGIDFWAVPREKIFFYGRSPLFPPAQVSWEAEKCQDISYGDWFDIVYRGLASTCSAGSFYNPTPQAGCPRVPAVGESPTTCDYIAIDVNGVIHRHVELGFFGGAEHYVLAHEYAHAIQWRTGLIGMWYDGLLSQLDLELQADCFTGAEMASTTPEYAFDLFVAKGSDYWSRLGSWDRPERTHGTPEERERAFSFGANNGAAACVTEYTPEYEAAGAFPSAQASVGVAQFSGDFSEVLIPVSTSGDLIITQVCAFYFFESGEPVPAGTDPAHGIQGQLATCAPASIGQQAVIRTPLSQFPPGPNRYEVIGAGYDGTDLLITSSPGAPFSLDV